MEAGLNLSQNEQMKTTSSEKYLGDIINNTGKLNENIQARINKATGTVNTIISLIQGVHLNVLKVIYL